MQFSFWEHNFYNTSKANVIIGSGIVGLSTAIEIKTQLPEEEVVIIDKYHMPQGASTKNAGFACFGSVTEIMDDLDHMPEEDVKEIIKMRWQGIQILKQRLEAKNIAITFDGGREMFSKGDFPQEQVIQQCNKIMKEAIGLDQYFKTEEQHDFGAFNRQCITMPYEGELDAAMMWNALYDTAKELGVKFIAGYAVRDFSFDLKTINLAEGLSLNYHRLFICTNGFTKKLLPDTELYPARNHVLVSNELPDLQWKGVYHFDKGYYYFRRIGNRILLGGARNLEPENEVTDAFTFNQNIQNELIHFLQHKLSPCCKVYPEFWWTGILGLGKSKYPIVEQIENDVYLGVRLGGMGVAIGSYLGKKLVALAFNN